MSCRSLRPLVIVVVVVYTLSIGAVLITLHIAKRHLRPAPPESVGVPKDRIVELQLEQGEPFTATGTFSGLGESYSQPDPAKEPSRIQQSFWMWEEKKSAWENKGQSGGAWWGELPKDGETVTITSPTGYTRDVVITNTTTGKMYRSSSEHQIAFPTYLFHYKLFKEGKSPHFTGTIYARSVDKATMFVCHHGRESQGNNRLFIWKDGEEEPKLPLSIPFACGHN